MIYFFHKYTDLHLNVSSRVGIHCRSFKPVCIFLIVAIKPQMFITIAIIWFPRRHSSRSLWILNALLFLLTFITEESSSGSVWEKPHPDEPAKFHMSSPVQLWLKMKPGRPKRYHTSSDCILGTMGSALIQGLDFHFNFLLSGVDVCGESLHSLALHLHSIY